MYVSIGDLASLTHTSRRSVALKTELDALTQELTTGKVRDVTAHLGSDMGFYADVEARLTRLSALSVSATEAELFGDAAQNVVGRLSDVSEDLASDLILVSNTGMSHSRSQLATDARDQLQLVISALNGSIAGRAMFSGVATDQIPLEDADTLIAAVQAEVAGLASPTLIMDQIDAWFDDPAGFDAVMYNGSDQSLADVQVAEDVKVGFDLKANDPAFREVMKVAVVGAIADDAALSLSESDRMDLLRSAGDRMLAAGTMLAETSGTLGAIQERVETASARNAATRTSLEYWRTELVSADPYEISVRLEQVQFQLESLFSITARSSRLSLTNFL